MSRSGADKPGVNADTLTVTPTMNDAGGLDRVPTADAWTNETSRSDGAVGDVASHGDSYAASDDASSSEPRREAENLALMQTARKTLRPVKRAMAFAAFNAWSLAAMAGLSLLLTLTGPANLIGAVLLGAAAFAEFTGLKKLKNMDADGAVWLTRNQLAILVMVVAYCGWKVYSAMYGPSAYEQAIAENPEVADMLGDFDAVIRDLSVLMYSAVGLLAGIWQLVMARFYHRTGKRLRQWRAQTPAWVVEAQKA